MSTWELKHKQKISIVLEKPEMIRPNIYLVLPTLR